MKIYIENISIDTQDEDVKRTEDSTNYEAVINASDSPFTATRHLFLNYFAGHHHFSYDEWMSLPDDDKSAALFLNFYDQITLAWYKAKSFYAQDEEAVETVMQYLEKNIPIIKKSKSKYSEAYVYRVAYNCTYCIAHDRKIDKDRWAYETSNIQKSNSTDDEVNLFDTCGTSTLESDLFKRAEVSRFWKLIEDVDLDAVDVALKLINGESLGRSNADKRRAAEIISKLKVVLKPYFDGEMSI